MEPMKIPKPMVTALNFIILQGRLVVGGNPCRRVLGVSELVDLDPRTEEFVTNDVFTYNVRDDSFVYNGRSYIVERIARVKGLSSDDVNRDLAERRMVLEWLVKKGIRGYRELTAVVGEYYRSREALLNKVRMDLF